jgi:hypothetical protein
MPPPDLPRSVAGDLLTIVRADEAIAGLGRARAEAEARVLAALVSSGRRFLIGPDNVFTVGPDGRLAYHPHVWSHELTYPEPEDDDGPPPVADAATGSEPEEGTQDELRAALAEHGLVIAAGQPDDRRSAEMAFVEAFDDLHDPMDHITGHEACS